MSTHKTTTREKAKAVSLAAKAGAALAAAAAIAVAGLGLPGAAPAAPQGPLALPDTPGYTPPQIDTGAQISQVNLSGTSRRFGALSNAPRIPEAAPTPDFETEAPPPTPPAPTGPEIKYLGPISVGSLKLAMVTVDNVQKVVGRNERIADGKLVDITDQHIGVERENRVFIIERLNKSDDVLGVAAAPQNKIGEEVPGLPLRVGARPFSGKSKDDMMARQSPPKIDALSGPDRAAFNRLYAMRRNAAPNEDDVMRQHWAMEQLQIENEVRFGVNPGKGNGPAPQTPIVGGGGNPNLPRKGT